MVEGKGTGGPRDVERLRLGLQAGIRNIGDERSGNLSRLRGNREGFLTRLGSGYERSFAFLIDGIELLRQTRVCVPYLVHHTFRPVEILVFTLRRPFVRRA